MAKGVDAIIIGAGPSGIALAHKLKQTMGFKDFTVYEKMDGPGGTWRVNTYPGCGCDIPTHLYSFSFNLNPKWSKELCDQQEILEYMESTVDKFKLREHMRFNISCEGAKWNATKGKWVVQLYDEKTKRSFTQEASVFVSAIGGIAEPRKINFPGMDDFQGRVFHTARWDHSYDYKGKRMAVIGNGCSAAQVVPSVVKDVAYLKQFARSPQWYHERPNRYFTSFEKFCFQYIPFWQRYHRYSIFQSSDALVGTYMPGEAAQAKRKATEEGAKNYIYRTAPEKYHSFLVPKFPLGCKRRIFDPNYLESLHAPNMSLVPEGISKIDATGITSETGVREEFDVIVLATGFEVAEFLGPLKIKGTDGVDLHEQWSKHVGAQAYMGIYVHNFPNFAIMFGPNTFPAHNSVLFASEVQVDYIAKTLFRTLIDGRAKVVEVKQDAEENFATSVNTELTGTVFSADCSNWYINKSGRNSASWPGRAAAYWRETFFPRWKDYQLSQGDNLWVLRSAIHSVTDLVFSKYMLVGAVALVGLSARTSTFDQALAPLSRLVASVR